LCDNLIIPVGSLGTLPSLLPIGSSNEADRKDLELRDRVLQLAASGQVEQALQVVQGIEDESGKYWTLFEMAVKLAEAGQYNQASQVIQLIQNDHQQDSFYNSFWYRLPIVLTEAEQVSPVVEVAQAIKDNARKADVLYHTAVRLAEAGHDTAKELTP
jgi:thioredoxin-like negative regulator of GroEL